MYKNISLRLARIEKNKLSFKTIWGKKYFQKKNVLKFNIKFIQPIDRSPVKRKFRINERLKKSW